MTDQDRKNMIQKGFDTVCQGYDHPSLCFFPQTANHIMKHLNLQPQQQLLDVCTGTGVVALAAAEVLTDGKVTGIDLSSGMLQQAKNKAADQTLNNTEFMQMDLDHLSFAEESFDVATSSFGIFFLEDMTRGLSNIAKVVKSGGKIAISSFTGDAFAPMSDLFVEQFELTGRTVPPLSWKRLATKELIEKEFNAIGITNISVHHHPLGYQMTSADMWWDVVWNAGWRALLNQLTADELAQFKQLHLEKVSEVIGDNGVWFNTEVLIAVAEK